MPTPMSFVTTICRVANPSMTTMSSGSVRLGLMRYINKGREFL